MLPELIQQCTTREHVTPANEKASPTSEVTRQLKVPPNIFMPNKIREEQNKALETAKIVISCFMSGNMLSTYMRDETRSALMQLDGTFKTYQQSWSRLLGPAKQLDICLDLLWSELVIMLMGKDPESQIETMALHGHREVKDAALIGSLLADVEAQFEDESNPPSQEATNALIKSFTRWQGMLEIYVAAVEELQSNEAKMAKMVLVANQMISEDWQQASEKEKLPVEEVKQLPLLQRLNPREFWFRQDSSAA
ncbi:MAG: hypothetical protein M1828_003359 [Chrysothrix sp. TS-e1954]|nr:MAG: hypothetical protein M1828_003359 [Chrysothrix sp. TS-e1954]